MDYWYYEYEVEVCEDGNAVLRQGVVSATSYTGAVDSIEEFYHKELIQIYRITCISDCVYEFNGDNTVFKVNMEEGNKNG